MPSWINVMWFFIVFLPMIYICYVLLQSFDYTKILRPRKTRELRVLLLIISICIAFVFALCFVTVIEKIQSLLI